jgi:hypothetical protein
VRFYCARLILRKGIANSEKISCKKKIHETLAHKKSRHQMHESVQIKNNSKAPVETVLC